MSRKKKDAPRRCAISFCITRTDGRSPMCETHWAAMPDWARAEIRAGHKSLADQFALLGTLEKALEEGKTGEQITKPA